MGSFGLPGWAQCSHRVLKRRRKWKREIAEGVGLKSLTLKMEEGAVS